jgi:predicted transcriptional regulator
MTIMTPAQCRAARAMLDISREDIAAASGVSFATIRRHEQDLRPPVQPHMVRKIKMALEERGAVFIDASAAHAPGVTTAANPAV